MQELYTRVKSYVDSVKSAALNAFLARKEADNIPMQIGAVGDFKTPENITKPEVYNGAITSAIVQMQGVFHEMDSISNFSDTMTSTANQVLTTLEQKVQKLANEIDNSAYSYGVGAAYQSILNVGFLGDTNDNLLISARTPLLAVDKSTGVLTRPTALGISRVKSPAQQQMCRVEVENILGVSTEPQHPVSQAIDGDPTSYWQEVILSDVPIKGNPMALPWLSERYTNGAAVRVRFDFESMTPVSEIQIKELADYPLEVLEVCWATAPTRNFDPVYYSLFDGDFDNLYSGANWHYQADEVGAIGLAAAQPNPSQERTTLALPTEIGGELIADTSLYCYKAVFDSEAPIRTTTLWQDHLDLEASSVYELEFYARSNNSAGTITVRLSGATQNTDEVTIFQKTSATFNNWTKYSFLIRTPEGLSSKSVRLSFRLDQGYIMRLTHVVVHKFISAMLPCVTKSENGITRIDLTKETGAPIIGRTIWLTMAQKHYKLRTYKRRKSDMFSNDLWARLLGNSIPDATQASSIWRSDSDRILDAANSPMFTVARKLGGLVKGMLANLVSVAHQSADSVSFTKYEYTLGAYEIDLRFKDHTPSGSWVSKPVLTTGELRQLTLLPQVSELERDKVRFWVLPRKDTPVLEDNAIELNKDNGYSVFFKAAGEASSPVAISGITPSVAALSPVTKSQLLRTSTRHGTVVPESYPYFNADAVRSILTTITQNGMSNGDYPTMNKCNSYDPNAEHYIYTDSTDSLKIIDGYRPMAITLKLSKFNGGPDIVAPPDTVGRATFTRFTLIENEVLAKGNAQSNGTGEILYTTAKDIAWIPGLGARLTLFWRYRNDDDQDTRLDPSDYSIIWDAGNFSDDGDIDIYGDALATSRTIRVRVPQFYDNGDYTLVACYRTRIPHLVETGDVNGWVSAANGNDPALALQSFPVTRNVTDYLNANPSYSLRKYDSEKYPVFEYYINKDGVIVFADNFFDPDATQGYIIQLNYGTLDLQPRILITMDNPADGITTSSSPSLQGYSLLMNTRTI